jgi:hypothetical protein
MMLNSGFYKLYKMYCENVDLNQYTDTRFIDKKKVEMHNCASLPFFVRLKKWFIRSLKQETHHCFRYVPNDLSKIPWLP